jgi:hypothetical protein
MDETISRSLVCNQSRSRYNSSEARSEASNKIPTNEPVHCVLWLILSIKTSNRTIRPTMFASSARCLLSSNVGARTQRGCSFRNITRSCGLRVSQALNYNSVNASSKRYLSVAKSAETAAQGTSTSLLWSHVAHVTPANPQRIPCIWIIPVP